MGVLFYWWLVRLCLNTGYAKKNVGGTPTLEEELPGEVTTHENNNYEHTSQRLAAARGY